MLELQDKTYEAGEKDIAKAYKKLALRYHPDKLGDRITEKDKEIWLKIQEAYETLIDPAKRRKYDSSLPFEDKIPGKDDFTEETFYDVLGAAFTLNSMWSKKKPTPNLGDENTPLDEVKRFYKFWDSFQSWREFSQYDEYDVNDAQDRYEKRAMERENKKARAEYVNAERRRLMKLTETAYDNDPRIQKELKDIEEEKQRKKTEKWAHKQREKQAVQDGIDKKQAEKEAAVKAKADKDLAEKEARK